MTKEFKIGTKVEYKDGQGNWITSEIYRVSKSFVWFKGSGYERVKITTFEHFPNLFRIKK